MTPRYTQATDFWQERDFGQKISAVFEFIAAHAQPLGRVLLVLVVPVAALRAVAVALLRSGLLASWQAAAQAAAADASGHSGASYLRGILTTPLYYSNLAFTVFFHALLILTIYGYVLECLHPSAPGPVTVARVWAIVWRRLVGTFFSLIVLGVLATLGFAVFLIPGFYLSIAFSLFFIIKLVEGGDFMTTLSRCLSLIKGKWWSTFGLVFIMLLMLWGLQAGLGILSTVLTTSIVGSGLLGNLEGKSLLLNVVGLIIPFLSSFITLVLYPPILLALAFQYFNLVERREGVGLRALISQLGQPPLAGPTGTTYRPDEEGEY
jgi:hypothetical protein